jgi:DNA repair protein RadC
MQTMQDIRNTMAKLYRDLESGEIDLKTASELANITGKFLKAEQLELARNIFLNNQHKPVVIDAQSEGGISSVLR